MFFTYQRLADVATFQLGLIFSLIWGLAQQKRRIKKLEVCAMNKKIMGMAREKRK